jgi:putative component of toxin-antitoxin plasmid stabilization module
MGDDAGSQCVVFGREHGEPVYLTVDELLRLVNALKELSPDEFPRARSDADLVGRLAATARSMSDDPPCYDLRVLDTPAIRVVAGRIEQGQMLLDLLDKSAVDVIAAIREGLVRLRARVMDVGADNAIYFEDRGKSIVVLSGSGRRSDFQWVCSATEALERLRGLPDQPEPGSGPEVIRSEFIR